MAGTTIISNAVSPLGGGPSQVSVSTEKQKLIDALPADSRKASLTREIKKSPIIVLGSGISLSGISLIVSKDKGCRAINAQAFTHVTDPGIREALLSKIDREIAARTMRTSKEDRAVLETLRAAKVSLTSMVDSSAQDAFHMTANPLFERRALPESTVRDAPIPLQQLLDNPVFSQLAVGEAPSHFIAAGKILDAHLPGYTEAVSHMKAHFESIGATELYRSTLEAGILTNYDILNAFALKTAKHDGLSDMEFLTYLKDGQDAFLNPSGVERPSIKTIIAFAWFEQAVGSHGMYDRGTTKWTLPPGKATELIALFKRAGSGYRMFSTHFKDGKVGGYYEATIPGSLRPHMPGYSGNFHFSLVLPPDQKEFVRNARDILRSRKSPTEKAAALRALHGRLFSTELHEERLTSLLGLRSRTKAAIADAMRYEVGIYMKEEGHGLRARHPWEAVKHAAGNKVRSMLGRPDTEPTSRFARSKTGADIRPSEFRKEHVSGGLGPGFMTAVSNLISGLHEAGLETTLTVGTKVRFTHGKRDRTGDAAESTKSKESAPKMIDTDGKKRDVSASYVFREAERAIHTCTDHTQKSELEARYAEAVRLFRLSRPGVDPLGRNGEISGNEKSCRFEQGPDGRFSVKTDGFRSISIWNPGSTSI
jgi:hypothetical protein